MKQKIAEWINIIFGFRKFIAWLALFLVGIVFRVKGLIAGAEFVDLIKGTFMGFVAANGVEHIMTNIKGIMDNKNAAQSAAVADTDPSNDDKEVTPVVEG
jgi:hypothetical protein